MAYYLYILFFLLFCLIFDITNNGGRNRNRNVLIFISFLLLMFLRTFVNTESLPDLTFYSRIFYDYRTLNFDGLVSMSVLRELELGYILFTKFCAIIFPSFHYELMLISCIILSSYFKIMKKYSNMIWLSILVYFILIFPNSTYVIRQFFAMAILFTAIPYIIEKKLVPFLLTIIISFFIHYSSIVWLPIYFIYGVKNKKHLLLIMAMFAVAIYVYSYNIDNLFSFGGFEKYQSYIEGDKVISSYFGAILNTIYLLLYIMIYKYRVFEDGTNRLLFIFGLITVILSWNSINGIGLMFRIIVYFSQMNILLLPKIVVNVRDRYIRFILVFSILLLQIIPNYFSERDFHMHQFYYEGDMLFIITIFLSLFFYVKFVGNKQRKENIFISK